METRRSSRPHEQLYGRALLGGRIRCLSGLRIGGRSGDLAAGGIDQAIVRDPLTYRPYIPGSALRGKLRSLVERAEGLEPNWERGGVRIHVCLRHPACVVCRLFGVPSQMETAGTTRLIVRDTFLDDAGAQRLAGLHTDLPFTEVKVEAAIDRLTAAAAPREVERIPAGAVFPGVELLFSIYQAQDFDDLLVLAQGLALLEDDYLGAGGSRGAGQVQFEALTLTARSVASYGGHAAAAPARPQLALGKVSDLLARRDEVLSFLQEHIPLGGPAPAPEPGPASGAPPASDVALVAEPPPEAPAGPPEDARPPAEDAEPAGETASAEGSDAAVEAASPEASPDAETGPADEPPGADAAPPDQGEVIPAVEEGSTAEGPSAPQPVVQPSDADAMPPADESQESGTAPEGESTDQDNPR